MNHTELKLECKTVKNGDGFVAWLKDWLIVISLLYVNIVQRLKWTWTPGLFDVQDKFQPNPVNKQISRLLCECRISEVYIWCVGSDLFIPLKEAPSRERGGNMTTSPPWRLRAYSWMQEWEWGLSYNFTAEQDGIRHARAERKRGDFSMNDMFVDSFNGEFGNAATCSRG